MAEKLDPKEVVSFEELVTYEVIQSEALINLLDLKGIITKSELLEEMKRVKATLPKSERKGKRTSKITREKALAIAMSHTGVLPCHGITDKYDPGWVIYAAERLADCWYITFSSYLTGFSIGPFYLVAVSKKDGSIRYSGSTGGD